MQLGHRGRQIPDFVRFYSVFFKVISGALSYWLHINQSDIWKEYSSDYQQRSLHEKSDSLGGKIGGHFVDDLHIDDGKSFQTIVRPDDVSTETAKEDMRPDDMPSTMTDVTTTTTTPTGMVYILFRITIVLLF